MIEPRMAVKSRAGETGPDGDHPVYASRLLARVCVRVARLDPGEDAPFTDPASRAERRVLTWALRLGQDRQLATALEHDQQLAVALRRVADRTRHRALIRALELFEARDLVRLPVDAH
jgi:hypothetical protein